ncbi:hypothetical protein HJZ16_005010 [Escherichia coli]|nr:hypothetical protein RG56_25255 [Escherichia coli]ELC78339.1 hypothetical protein A13M_04278 [Escherichia coli KTE188]ELD57699.1 hypothetical protein A17Y_04173 [Escherichia coli KTE230]EQZ52937.1 hypothetical protein G983_02359 [Escherichia coli UMEA 3656-1]APL15213.1 hypothetical protein RG58_20000 [Escherichia coli]
MYAAELVTGALQSLTPSLVLLICHKILVRQLNHFIQQFFGGHHDFGQYFQAVCGFFRTVSAERNHQHVHHAFFVAPGHFSVHPQYSCSSRIFADFKNANKTSVHDVQIKLPGTGVRKPPVSLLFPECAGYEKPEIQSLL